MKNQDQQWQAYQQKYQEYVEAYQKQQAAAASQQVVMFTAEQLYAAGPTGTPLYDNGREMYDAQGILQPYSPAPVLQPQTYYPNDQMDYPNTQSWTALGRQARGSSTTYMPDEQLEYAEDLITPAAREPQAKIPRLCYVNGKPVEDNESRNWREVRVLADEGGKEMLGTMSLEQATIMAQERGTDVIVLNPDLSTPLVRLWEWSK
ncbi:translation initiation factor IF-3, partial [Haematococcus lacustris]